MIVEKHCSPSNGRLLLKKEKETPPPKKQHHMAPHVAGLLMEDSSFFTGRVL